MVWRGDTQLAPHEQGIIVLGSPFGQEAFIMAQLSAKREEHQVLLDRIPYRLHGCCCCSVVPYGPTTGFETVSPRFSGGFAQEHDQAVMRCLGRIIRVDPSSIHPSVHEAATLPFSLGGLGIRSAFRSRESAHWASWADCLAMVKARHPIVAARIVWGIGQVHTSCMPWRRAGLVLWRWARLASNFHRGPHWQTEPVRCLHEGNVQDQPRCGWQREVSLKVEQHFRDTWLLPTMTEPDQALLRSQGGPLAAVPFTSCPTDRLFRIEPQCFRVLLLRRLRLPLPLSQRNCRCRRPLDVLGHHRAACAMAGVLGRRGFAVESVVARICREGGARVTTNMFVRDMDLRGFRQVGWATSGSRCRWPPTIRRRATCH